MQKKTPRQNLKIRIPKKVPRSVVRALSPLKRLSLSSDKKEDWDIGLERLRRDPELERSYNDLREKLDQARNEIQKQAEATDWSREDSYELVSVSVIHGVLGKIAEIFLPRHLSALPRETKIQYFTEWLLLRIAIILRENPEAFKMTHPKLRRVPRLFWAFIFPWMCAFIDIMAPYALAEVVRRGRTHVGFPAGLLSAIDWAKKMTRERFAEREQYILLGILGKSVWKKICAIMHHDRMEFSDKTKERQRQWDELLSQTFLTVVSEYGKLDPFRTLAEAADGLLNVAPKAIVFDFIDQYRKDKKRKGVIRLEADHARRDDEEAEEADEEIVFKVEEQIEETTRKYMESLNQIESKIDNQKLLFEFLKDHPEHKGGVEALLSDKPLKVLAKRQRVTVQTIINRKERAKTALRVWGKNLTNRKPT